MKKTILTLISISAFFFAPLVAASILTYDFAVTGSPWTGTNPRPYGLPLQPAPLSGKLTVDNTKTDKTGLVDFVFVTGTKTWTENFGDRTTPVPTFFTFNASGDLTEFLVNLKDDPSFLFLASSNTMGLSDGTLSLNCNGCVSFSRATASAPVPGTLALLLGAGAVAGGMARRRWSPR